MRAAADERRVARVLVVLAALGLVAGLAPAAGADTEVRYAYEVHSRGQVQTAVGSFAAAADEILGDARGWTLGGSVAFHQVGSGGEFNLILASPQAVENAAPVCSRQYSCRVGNDVYINDDNWRNATPAWRDAGGDMTTYRRYLVTHEVGHWLEFEHADCPGASEPAPVMQQQSISLDGCDPNGWPLGRERQQLGDRLGVPVYDDWVFPDVPRGVAHRDAIHAVADAGIASGFADGFYRPGRDITRAQMATFLARTFDISSDQPPPFDDVEPGDAHAQAIAAVAEHGIATGYPDNTFRPGQSVTRGQMATFLAEGFDYEAEGGPPFEDVPDDHVHAEGIAAAAEEGVAAGYPDGTYRPNEHVSRAHMAAFVTRAHPDL